MSGSCFMELTLKMSATSTLKDLTEVYVELMVSGFITIALGEGGVTKVTFMIEQVFTDKLRPRQKAIKDKKRKKHVRISIYPRTIEGLVHRESEGGKPNNLGENAQSNDKNKQQ